MGDLTPGLVGIQLVSPADAAQRGGSVMLKVPASIDPARLVQTMREQDIWADCRGTTLRLSPGHVTTVGGVEGLLAMLARQRRKN